MQPMYLQNELQSNGVYKFYLAFKNSELDFMKFYESLPENELKQYAVYPKPIQPNTEEKELTKM